MSNSFGQGACGSVLLLRCCQVLPLLTPHSQEVQYLHQDTAWFPFISILYVQFSQSKGATVQQLILCRGLAAWRRFYLWWKIFFRWKYIFTWFKSKNTSMDKHIILKNFWAKKNKRKIIKRFGFQRMPCVVLKERGGNNGGIKNRLFIFTLQLNPDHLLKENIPQMICSVILHTEVGLKLSKISVSSEKVFFCHVFAGLHSLWWIFTAKSKLHVMKMFFNQMYLFLVWVCN